MDQDLKNKVLMKMFHSRQITEQEYATQDVSAQRIEMYIRGVEIIEEELSNEITFDSQIKHYQRRALAFGEKGDSSEVKKNTNIVKKIIKAKDGFKIEGYVEKPQLKASFSGAKNQMEEVKRHLYEVGHLTTFEAFSEYGITRLSDKIFKLRGIGWKIKNDNVTKTNRYGSLVTFKKYTLVEEEN